MQTIIITFTSDYEKSNGRGKTYEVKAKVQSATADAIKRILAKEKNGINRWLAWGKVPMRISNEQTGDVIATGWYEFDSFSGRGEYEFKMER